MELIPILATIILVATISTFILAIGAYILYKVRESRGQQVEVAQPATVQAELLTPEALEQQVTVESPLPAGQVIYEQPKVPAYKPSVEPIFVKQGVGAKQPIQSPYAAAKPFVAAKTEKPRRAIQGQAAPGSLTDQKFMKYTSEGYVSTKEETKKQGALKWR